MKDKDYAALRQYLMLHCIMNFWAALLGGAVGFATVAHVSPSQSGRRKGRHKHVFGSGPAC